MKHLIMLFLIYFLSFGCTSMEKFNLEDQKPSGISFKQGTNQGIRVGDKIKAYKRVCSSLEAPSFRNCSYNTLGMLTVVTTTDSSSILKKDGNFDLTDEVYFERDHKCSTRRSANHPDC